MSAGRTEKASVMYTLTGLLLLLETLSNRVFNLGTPIPLATLLTTSRGWLMFY